MSDARTMWQALQARWLRLIEDATPDQLAGRVPATPAWSVKDLFAHVVGVDADAVAGTSAEGNPPEWTQSHVDARADASAADVAAEWRAMTPAVLELLDSAGPETATGLVLDGFIHEQDVRTALPGGPVTDDPAVRLTLGVFAAMFDAGVRSAALPAIQLQSQDWIFVAGEGEAAVTVTAPEYDLMRALTGRRSAAQILEWDWSGDGSPYLQLLSPFGLQDMALTE